MDEPGRAPSRRKEELLELAYEYVLHHGLAEMSLRPLAAAVGSSPRVLLFLFGSKDGLVRALLARARADELALLEQARADAAGGGDLVEVARTTWAWLAAERHRRLLNLWVEAYGRSLTEPDGPWSAFARQTVQDWLSVLTAARQPPSPGTRASAGTGWRAGARGRTGVRDQAACTLTLAVLRGAMLDLLATGDLDRTTAAVELHLRHLPVTTAARSTPQARPRPRKLRPEDTP